MTDRALAGEALPELPLAKHSYLEPVSPLISRGRPLYTEEQAREYGLQCYAAGVAASSSMLEQAVEALEMAQTGLKWYRDMHPEDTDGSDDEADAEIDATLTALRAHLKPDTEVHSTAPQTKAASGVEADALPLTRLDALARLYAASYASPHHFTMSVEGLRNLIEALKEPSNG